MAQIELRNRVLDNTDRTYGSYRSLPAILPRSCIAYASGIDLPYKIEIVKWRVDLSDV